MNSPHDDQRAQQLLRVNEYVVSQQQAYAALSTEEQRQRGPCTLDHLLEQVMRHLADDVSDGDGGGVHVSTTELPFAVRDIPALATLAALQMRLTATVLSAISTHPIITLFDLEEWICAREGVDSFIDLGCGVGLQVLPVVQQYFQLRANSIVFPVRTRDVLTFLLSDPDARELLLYGGGDARDLLNRFSHFYERTVLAVSTSETDCSSSRSRSRRVQNVRQLGVHVQDYASFLAMLAQELVHMEETTRTSAGVATSCVYRCEQNRPLYERAMQSFDAACAERALIAEVRHAREVAGAAAAAAHRRTHADKGDDDASGAARATIDTGVVSSSYSSTAAARSWSFVVSCTEREARQYAVPLTLWRDAPLAGSSLGGVQLCFHLGADPTATNTVDGVHEVKDGGTARCTNEMRRLAVDAVPSGAADSVLVTSSSLPDRCATPAGPPPLRRRRGTVVSDVTSCALSAPATEAPVVAVPLPASSARSTLLSALLQPAGSMGLAPTGGAAVVVSSESPACAEGMQGSSHTTETVSHVHTREAAVAAPTPLEELCAYVRGEVSNGVAAVSPTTDEQTCVERIDTATRLLERLCAGDTVSADFLFEVWGCVQKRFTQLRAASSVSSRQDEASQPIPASVTPLFFSEWRQRRFIPLFTLPTVSSYGNSGSAAAPNSVSRLAALRRHLAGGVAGCSSGMGGSPGTTQNGSSSSTASRVGTALVLSEIVYMASPAEVCWTSWLPAAPSASPAPALAYASLEQHYPQRLQSCFSDVFGVAVAPTMAAWCTTAACLRRVLSPAFLSEAFAQEYLDSFARCVEADVEARLLGSGATTAKTDAPSCSPAGKPWTRTEAALQAALNALREALKISPWRAGLFPCDRAWRCALDGLLYATPRLCGYHGVLLTPVAEAQGNVPPLRVLRFTTAAPSWCVGAALHFLGIRSLDDVVETRVSFSSTIHTQASGVLHEKIAAMVPYLQGFCRSRFPQWYAMAYTPLQQRLRHLRVVLTTAGATAPQQLLRLHWDGHVYAYQRDIRLEYVAAHNILFGTAEDYAVPMLAEALLPLFTPLPFTKEEDFVEWRGVLSALLGAVSSLQSSFDDWDSVATQRQLHTQVEEVLAGVAATYGFAPYHHVERVGGGDDPAAKAEVVAPHHAHTSQLDNGVAAAVTVGAGSFGAQCRNDTAAELPFPLPSRPFARYQSYFPPGTDALRQPRGPPTRSGGDPARSSHPPQQPHGHRDAALIRKLTRTDAAELAAAGCDVTRASGVVATRGALQQRLSGDGRLRITVALPGSGGRTSVVTSHPAWLNFPMAVNVGRVVASCTGNSGLSLANRKEGEEEEEEKQTADEPLDDDFLSFQYHRREPMKPSATVVSAGCKRMRGEASDVAVHDRHHDSRSQSLASASWWMRPPASSTIAGGGGTDTPAYAVAAERFVYELLCSEYAEQMQRDGVRVLWVNEHTEAGSPFDILIARPRSSSAALLRRGNGPNGESPEGWDVVAYVEVKSTCTAHRQEFELSLAELLFAARFGAAYKVYRVFGASTDPLRRMRCVVYADLVQMWYRAELTITSEIRVTPSK
jgi:hypothetical protein